MLPHTLPEGIGLICVTVFIAGFRNNSVNIRIILIINVTRTIIMWLKKLIGPTICQDDANNVLPEISSFGLTEIFDL